MAIDLTQNYFEVFGLPVQYDVDMARLNSRFRELQALVHPDKFINATDEERRMAMQRTTFLNEAYNTLKMPRLRARYLLGLQGVEFNEESDTTSDINYLMEQMEIRESIEEAEHSEDPFAELEQLARIVKSRQQDVENEFRTSFAKGDYESSKQAALKLRFCERIFSEIQRIEERLDDL